MRFHEESLKVKTKKMLEVIDVTEDVRQVLKRSDVTRGLLNLWVAHTTACLAVNEHEEGLWEDLLTVLTRLVPVKGEYHHKQNAHAHILSSMIKPGVSIPVVNGEMKLGTWQSILFIELDGPSEREVNITVMGE